MMKNTVCIFILFSMPFLAQANLIQAWELAQQRDAQYQKALADHDVGIEEATLSRARLLPQLSATGSLGKANTTTTRDGLLGEQVRRDRYDTLAWSIQLRQAIWRPSLVAGYQQGQALTRAAEAQLAAAKQSLMLRLIENLTKLAETESAYRLAELTVETRQQLRNQSAQLVRVGEMTRAEASDAKARLAQARRDLRQAESAWREEQVSWRLMTSDLANQPTFDVKLHGALRASLPFTKELMLIQAQQKNPVLRAIREELEASQQDLRRVKSERLPSLDFYASLAFNDSDTDNTIGTGFETTRYGIQASLPIFSGGALAAQIRQAAARMSASKAQLNRFIEQADVMTTRESIQFEQAHDQAVFAAESLEAANDQYRLTELGRRAGTSTLLQFVEAELAVARARHESTLANVQMVLVWSRLHDLLGTLDETQLALLDSHLKLL